jgi:DNA-binding CsgD family transcriptional regulator
MTDETGVPPAIRARTRIEAAWLELAQGQLAAAQSLLDDASLLAHEVRSPFQRLDLVEIGSMLAFLQGDLVQAEALAGEAEAMLRDLVAAGRMGSLRLASALTTLGVIAHTAGDLNLATARFTEGLDLAVGAGGARERSQCLCGLGYLQLQQSMVPEAATSFLEGLALAWNVPDEALVGDLLRGIAGTLAERPQPEMAAQLIGATVPIDARTGFAPWPLDRVFMEACRSGLERELGAGRLAELRRAGSTWSIDDAVAIASAAVAAILGEEPVAAIWLATGAPAPASALVERIATAPDGETDRARFVQPPVGLTRREREILGLLAQRLTDPEIGERLFISPRTASRHVANIFTKLEVSTRREAIAFAAAHDLI